MPLAKPREFQSQRVELNWRFGLPQVSPDPEDRGMKSAADLPAPDGPPVAETAAAELPGLGAGEMATETVEAGGLRIGCQIFRPECGARLAVRGRVENLSGKGVRLGEWPLLVAEGPAGLRLGDAAAGEWRMFRNGRHKNDHPVVVGLGRVDRNYLDAAGCGSETGDVVEAGAPLTLANDPMTVLAAEGLGKSLTTLLVGFLSQLAHLSFITLAMDEDRSALASLAAVAEFDGCLLPPGETRETSWLLLDAGDDPFQSIRAYADSVAALHGFPPPKPPKNVYCTWYFYGRDDIAPQTVKDDLSWLAENRWPIDTFQIDSGWEVRHGDWRTKPEWGGDDVAAFAERIRQAGFEPGLWTSPYIADVDSDLAREHPDWILKDSGGEPVIFVMGGRDNYTLDPTHPEVLAWFKELYGGLRRMGYSYHKFDFMRAVAQASLSTMGSEADALSGPQGANAAFHDPTATRAEAYRRGLQAIRDALGEDAYLLVCGGLYLPSMGLADAQRSGSDVKSTWTKPRADTRIRQNLLRWWMNPLWRQDPDSMMVRRREKPYNENPLSIGLFTDNEARTVAVNQYLGGGLVCFTERMCELDADRAGLYRMCIPSLGVESVPADLFSGKRIPAIHVTRVPSPADGLPGWLTVAAINWGDLNAVHLNYLKVGDLRQGLPDAPYYLLWEYFGQEYLGLIQSGEYFPMVMVPIHGVRIVRVAPWDGRTPTLVGGDRHLSMGGTEIAEWRCEGGRVKAKVQSPWPGDFHLWFALPGFSPEDPRIVKKRVWDGAEVEV